MDKKSRQKLLELIIYIATKAKDDENLGVTKLNKLLFYVDFLYFLNTGKSISGQIYIHRDLGPVPKDCLTVQKQADRKDIATAHEMRGPFEQKRIVALRQPNLAYFKPEMIAHIDNIIETFCGNETSLTAKAIVRESHEHMGWIITKDGEEIPYEAAYLKDVGKQVVTPTDKVNVQQIVELLNGKYDINAPTRSTAKEAAAAC